MTLRVRSALFGVCLALALPASLQAEIILTAQEIKQTLRHGPWPTDVTPDPSNRVSGNPEAISFGQRLFNDPVLSADGVMTCATCHDPDRDFTDARARAMGRELLARNTQSLWNLSDHRWFGWGGENDNLWAQSLKPILNPKEMAHSEQSLFDAIAESESRQSYEALFGDMSEQGLTVTSVNIAKVLAAYVETLRTKQTSFDRFRDALAIGDMDTAGAYPLDAQRGLQIFLGRGNCAFCHSGPAFTNGEFHDAGVPYFISPGVVDQGRAGGLDALAASLFTLDGEFNDDPSKSGAWAVRSVRFQHGNFGIFRVPSLRRATKTAPYMHNGSLPDLGAVLDHYNNINMERLHTDGEAILRPLGLTAREIGDLQAFLQSLSDD